MEQYNSSFWYPMSYEGLEASPNIFYTGSTINQQVIPAVEWCIKEGFRSYYLLGSDSIYPITTNKLVRSLLLNHKLEMCRENLSAARARRFSIDDSRYSKRTTRHCHQYAQRRQQSVFFQATVRSRDHRGATPNPVELHCRTEIPNDGR